MPGQFSVEINSYLISSILFKERDRDGTINVMRFLKRRAKRLYPPLLVMLAAAAVIVPMLWPDVPTLLVLFLAAFYLTDMFGKEVPIVGHTWSLSVEMQFYLIWPIVVFWLGPRIRTRALLLMFAAVTLWRLGNGIYFHDFAQTAFRFDMRLSGLILGSAIAAGGFALKGRMAEMVGLASTTLLLFLSVVLWQDAVMMAYVQPTIDLAAAGLIISLVASEGTIINKVFSWRPLAWVGLISYSLYLWHLPIARAAMLYSDDWRVVLAATVALSVPIAALSYAFIEKPMQRRRTAQLAI
ncbi:acyltransferase family protein [Mesorhizobium newzealandense]|uniref:Acyltransferase family protein n=1 Tax=Mesorhizobium newzealandense TaxID=1300302 RepID=A0ABW4U7T0_9HYPH